MRRSKSEIEARLQSLGVLVVDDSHFMRKIVRNLLLSIGVKEVYEAADGIEALDTIRTVGPDVVVLDWELPLLDGAELVRIVRSPGIFPTPELPIIMLSSFGERWRVIEAARIGVNEFLVKPVSAKALYERLVSILVKPQSGDRHAPRPHAIDPTRESRAFPESVPTS
jgi:two-component system, chemotaxis family, chemotaxis protein CheY